MDPALAHVLVAQPVDVLEKTARSRTGIPT
jgi:hypothetical protein